MRNYTLRLVLLVAVGIALAIFGSGGAIAFIISRHNKQQSHELREEKNRLKREMQELEEKYPEAFRDLQKERDHDKQE